MEKLDFLVPDVEVVSSLVALELEFGKSAVSDVTPDVTPDVTRVESDVIIILDASRNVVGPFVASNVEFRLSTVRNPSIEVFLTSTCRVVVVAGLNAEVDVNSSLIPCKVVSGVATASDEVLGVSWAAVKSSVFSNPGTKPPSRSQTNLKNFIKHLAELLYQDYQSILLNFENCGLVS